MPALQIISSAGNTAAPETDAPLREDSKPSADAPPFDALIGQALNGKSASKPDGKGDAKDSDDSQDSGQSDAAKKKRAAPPADLNAPVCADGAAAQLLTTPPPIPQIQPVPPKTAGSTTASPKVETVASVSTGAETKNLPTATASATPAEKKASAETKAVEVSPASAPDPAEASAAKPVAARTAEAVPEKAATEKLPDSAKNSAPTPAKPEDGTSAAQQDSPMKQAEKTTEVAGLTEQKLPGTAAPSAGEPPPHRAEIPVKQGFSAASSDFSGPAGNAAPPSPASGIEMVSTAAIHSTNTLHTTERAYDLITSHALQLRESAADSLRVVIKPGTDTQLSLDLRMRAGVVEVSAAMNSGDYHFLKSQWPELQQQLEQRGIKLAPLTQENQPGGTPPDSSQAGRQGDREKFQSESAFAEFALSGSMRSKTPSLAASGSGRGWESWA